MKSLCQSGPSLGRFGKLHREALEGLRAAAEDLVNEAQGKGSQKEVGNLPDGVSVFLLFH